MRGLYLGAKQSKLSRIESIVADRAKLCLKIGTGYYTHVGSDVGCRAAEEFQRCIVEIITIADSLNFLEWRVTGPNDCDCTGSDLSTIQCCQPTACTKGLEGSHDVGPSRAPIGLYIYP